jgi:hypothetical protein
VFRDGFDDVDDDVVRRVVLIGFLLGFVVRFSGGDGVDMRLGSLNGITSAPGPIKLISTGKKKRPFNAPIVITDKSNQKKCLTTNSKGDVDSIKMAIVEVITPCSTGASECSSAKRIRRSQFPMAVMKLCKRKKNYEK